jgi:uncharacterized damage-inducible protein DinB
MTYYGAKELAASFRTVRGNTIKVAEDIPEDKYGFSPAPGARTVAQTLVHIAIAPRLAYQMHGVEKLTSLEGFDFMKHFGALTAELDKPRTKAEILTLLRGEGDKWAGWIETLSEDFLDDVLTMPAGAHPTSRTRFDMLLSTKEHEMHHRGQLMLVERILGITPHLTRDMQARMAAASTQQKQ